MVSLSTASLDYLQGFLDQVEDQRALRDHLENLLQLNGTLQEVLEDDLEHLLTAIPGNAGEAVRHLLASGGKRLRPMMALLAAGAGGERPEKGLPVATAVELLHTGSLLHDDVIDEGDLRRGQPTARKIFGNPVAVLAGDFCLFSALDSLLKVKDTPLIERAMGVARELTEAELWQLECRRDPRIRGEGTYYGIVERKTGSLFGLATYGGGRCAWAPDPVVERLDRFGRKLGIAFQIVDDLLDLEGDPTLVGKGLASDLAQGLVTLPVLYAAEADDGVRDRVETALARLTEDEDAAPDAGLLDAVRATPGPDRARDTAERYTREALDELEGLPGSRYREALALMAVNLIDRVR